MTVPESIQRFKGLADLSPAEHLEFARSGKRPETAQYIAARAEALKDAGLEGDDDQPPADRGEWTAEQHYNHMRGDQ